MPTIQSILSEMQTELKAPKTQTGRFGKSRNVEDILTALKPLLKKHNAAVTLNNSMIEVGGKIYLQATATLIFEEYSISATAHALEGEISRGLDAPQVTGSASSYARKYALGGLFAIDDTKDPDSHMDAPKVKPSTTTATYSQLEHLKQIISALGITDDETARYDFFQDAIGKGRPETKTEFDKAIDFGMTVLSDRNISIELKDRGIA